MSLRNKAFLTGTGAVASLRYGTTEAILLAADAPVYDRASAGGS